MDSMIQILDGLNGEDPKTLEEEKLMIRETFGSSKSDINGIRALQTMLGVKADGVIGPITRSAIVNWKLQNDLYGNGIWDQGARMKYLSGAAKSVPPPTTTQAKPPPAFFPPSTTQAEWPGSTPPPTTSLVPGPTSNATSFLDKLKGNTPTIVLVVGGLALVGGAIWYMNRSMRTA